MSIPSFRQSTSFERRKTCSRLLLEKYTDRIPIILEKSKTDKVLPTINKYKYLVHQELTIAGLLQLIRSELNINESLSIYISINSNIILSGSQTINQIYNEHHDEDGFLYLNYCGENVFG